MTITLYTSPKSRGRIIRWMLEETGVPYNVEIIRGAALKSPDYRAINPMAKIPALRHNQHIVTETAAICVYLAETFPEAGLAPTAEERAGYYRWLFFGAGPLEAAICNHVLGVHPTPEQRSFVGYGSYEEVMDALDQALSATGYITGDRFTAADVYIGAQVNFGLAFNTIEKRPSFIAYSQRLLNRPALLRATALDDADLAKL